MQQIRIDFDNPGLPQSLGAVEGESQSRIFQVALYKSGAAYTAPAGAVYSIMYRGFGPQNQGWYDTIEDGAGKRAACTVSGNVVTCELARQALRVPGHLTVVLCVSDAKGYMLKSWPIMADVRNDGYDDTGEGEMYFNLSGIAGNYLTQLEKAMTDAETTRNNLISTSAQVKKDIDAKAAETLKTIPESYTELDGSVKQLNEDLDNSIKDVWTWNGDFSKATEIFNPTDIVGNNFSFERGYIDCVELSVVSVSGNDATLFITDTNRKILFKTTKKIEENDLFIQVNKFFDVDFYVFVSYPGIKYYNSTDVQSDKWAGLSFSQYGNYIIGDVLADFNNNGKIGFSFKTKYYTTAGKIAENTKSIEKHHSTDTRIVSETDKAHFGIDENGILSSRKIGSMSGCYPCFFNETEHLKFKATNDKTWVIVSKDAIGNFVALGMERDGIIFASFNADGSVLAVDYTQNFVVGSWLNSEIALRWVDDYFCSIYRNGHFIYKFDIRHTSTTITDHCFGIGMYSNMENGVRAEIMEYDINDKVYFDDVCVLGDSFTDNIRDSLGAGTFYFTRWYEFAKEINHIKTVFNYGFGGTCMSPSVSGENSFYTRMQTMYSEHNNPSAVFVLGGTNDYHNDVPLGTINDVTTDTFYGTLNKMCEYFKENFHTSKVVFCTPIMRVSPSNGKTETTPANNQTNSNGNSLEQFANAMIEVCHKWALPCFDAYHNSGICPQARNTQNFAWFMNDGIHMKQNGHKQLGMRFGEFAKPFM